jgi:hypothetical protein
MSAPDASKDPPLSQQETFMTGANDLARMVPGFDFLQGLLKNAGAGLPNMGQWVAPTLNPEELEKRIQELKTVHFWLEQNAKLLATTIQALEVQRMTLSTLQTMNLPFADLGEALKIKVPSFTTPRAAAPESSNTTTAKTAPVPAKRKAASSKAVPTPKPSPKNAPPAIDPLQWWGALTQQFSELATKAVKDSAADTAKSLAGAMVKSSMDTASGALKAAAAMPVKAARAATVGAARASGARKRSR